MAAKPKVSRHRVWLSLTLAACLVFASMSAAIAAPPRGGQVNSQIGANNPDPKLILPRDAVARKPDLVVTAVRFTPSAPNTAQAVSISIDIANRGSAPAVFPTGATSWVAYRPSGATGGSEPTGYTLQPGQSITRENILFNPGDVNAGTHSIRVKIDPDNRVEESSEQNNETTVSVSMADGPKPDLVITEMALEPAQITTQTDFRVRVTIKNQGAYQAVFPPNSMIIGGPDLHYQYASTPVTLQPGESITYRLPKGNVQTGSFTWKAVVDPNNVVNESDNTNNTRSLSVQVDPPVANNADLVVTAVRFNPAAPTTTQTISISVDIKNQGTAPAIFPAGAVGWLAYRPDGSAVGTSESGYTLQPGQTMTRGINLFSPGSIGRGSHAITVKIDPNNRVGESNETNNQTTAILTVQ